MKRTVVLMTLIIAAAFSAFAQNRVAAKPDEKSLLQLTQFESDWLTASLNQDKSWLERFFAGQLFVVPVENAAVKNRARETVELIDPELKPDEMKVRIKGNISVMTNRATENGENRSYDFLDTFNRRGGKWQIIATHFSDAAATAGEDNEQTILRMERERTGAAVKKDVPALRRIIADDFGGVESSGRVINKTQIISDIETGSGDIQSETPEDVKVKIYGDTAVVTERFLINGKKNEANYRLELLFTDVWTKQDGQWQLVNFQATQIR